MREHSVVDRKLDICIDEERSLLIHIPGFDTRLLIVAEFNNELSLFFPLYKILYSHQRMKMKKLHNVVTQK